MYAYPTPNIDGILLKNPHYQRRKLGKMRRLKLPLLPEPEVATVQKYVQYGWSMMPMYFGS